MSKAPDRCLYCEGDWIHDEPTPSGNYLYCGFRAEREATDVVADAPDSAPDDAIGAD